MMRQITSPKSFHGMHRASPAYTLVELLVTVTILAIISLAILSRILPINDEVAENACYVNRGDIEVKAQLWFRNHGEWPSNSMATFGTDTEYFPDGQLPACPSGGTYTFDPSTGKVTCTNHP